MYWMDLKGVCMSRMEALPVRTEDELEFVIFCIENMALKQGKNARDVYVAMKDKSNILSNYIIPGYEFLHTQDKEYILEDIEGMMQEQGVSI